MIIFAAGLRRNRCPLRVLSLAADASLCVTCSNFLCLFSRRVSELVQSLLCNSTADCGVGRTCVFDDVLFADPDNPCGADGCFVCLHKALVPPGESDALGTGLLFLGGILAGASGIGGGGLNVPLLMHNGVYFWVRLLSM